MRCMLFFFFNDTATTEIYTLSLHDALPISYAVQWVENAVTLNHPVPVSRLPGFGDGRVSVQDAGAQLAAPLLQVRSEEHTSELQSRLHLVCRLLLEKKKKNVTSSASNRRCH